MLTYPCFRRGLKTAVVMEHAGCYHYLFYRGEPDGTLVLFPVAWLARDRVMMASLVAWSARARW